MKSKLNNKQKWELAKRLAGKAVLREGLSVESCDRMWRMELRLRAESAPEPFMRDNYRDMLIAATKPENRRWLDTLWQKNRKKK